MRSTVAANLVTDVFGNLSMTELITLVTLHGIERDFASPIVHDDGHTPAGLLLTTSIRRTHCGRTILPQPLDRNIDPVRYSVPRQHTLRYDTAWSYRYSSLEIWMFLRVAHGGS
jgi:hypothetical protein